MNNQSGGLAIPQGAAASTGADVRTTAPKRSFASRLFSYDIFLSFALGPPPRLHQGWVTSVALSPDNSLIVSGSANNTLRLWQAPKPWPDELCKKLTRNMSHKQWREWVSPEISYTCQHPVLPITPDGRRPYRHVRCAAPVTKFPPCPENNPCRAYS